MRDPAVWSMSNVLVLIERFCSWGTHIASFIIFFLKNTAEKKHFFKRRKINRNTRFEAISGEVSRNEGAHSRKQAIHIAGSQKATGMFLYDSVRPLKKNVFVEILILLLIGLWLNSNFLA